MSLTIKKICLFPFKSLKGIELDECQIDEHGFLHDRIYMLVRKGSNGEWSAVTQRSHPAMARITQTLQDGNLVLSYTNAQSEERTLKLPLDTSVFALDLPKIDMQLWDFPLTGLDVGTPAIKQFFLDFFADSGALKNAEASNLTVLASNVRRKVPATQELANGEIAREVTSSFQDIFPGTIMTTASYEDLKHHVSYLDEEASINMDSFRMNLLVETDEPWIEDDWKSFMIGKHLWAVQGPSERCSMPAVDQDKGQTRKNRHPLPSLNRFRVLEKGRAPCFGINIVNKDWGYNIKVGETLSAVVS